jgi:hypothetical protein
MPYIYDDLVLRQLGEHGIRPGADTRPSIVRAYLNDLYRYELRRLKVRLLRSEFPRASYFHRVVALRMRYPLLSIPERQWMAPGSTDPGEPPVC